MNARTCRLAAGAHGLDTLLDGDGDFRAQADTFGGLLGFVQCTNRKVLARTGADGALCSTGKQVGAGEPHLGGGLLDARFAAAFLAVDFQPLPQLIDCLARGPQRRDRGGHAQVGQHRRTLEAVAVNLPPCPAAIADGADIELIAFGHENIFDDDIVAAGRGHACHVPGVDHLCLTRRDHHLPRDRRAAGLLFERLEHDPGGMHDHGAPHPPSRQAIAAIHLCRLAGGKAALGAVVKGVLPHTSACVSSGIWAMNQLCSSAKQAGHPVEGQASAIGSVAEI